MSISDDTLRLWELLSYIATVVGIPVAVVIYWLDQKKGRLAEQWEIDDQLNAEYNDIIDRLIDSPELDCHDQPFTDEALAKRQYHVYEKLIGVFERAYIRLADERDPALKRMWNSWQDYISEWLARPNFRNALDDLLKGEDKSFIRYMRARVKDITTAVPPKAGASAPASNLT